MERIKFCSYCINCRVSPVYYVPECDDEEQDLYCTQLKKNVYEGLCWTEIAARHRRSDGQITGYDKIPKDCPLFPKNDIIFNNPSNGIKEDKDFLTELEEYANTLDTPDGVYVVYDSSGEIQYQGDLQHCFSYYLLYEKWKGYAPIIDTKQNYNKLMGK